MGPQQNLQIKGRLFSTDLNSSAAALSAAGLAFSGRFSSYLVRRCLVFFRPFSEDLALSGPQLTYKVGFEAALWLLAPGFFRHVTWRRVPLGAAVRCPLAVCSENSKRAKFGFYCLLISPHNHNSQPIGSCNYKKKSYQFWSFCQKKLCMLWVWHTGSFNSICPK